VESAVVGVASRYELNEPGFGCRQKPSTPDLVPTQPLVQCILGVFPGGNVAGALSGPLTTV
jgi:hypothetical protein